MNKYTKTIIIIIVAMTVFIAVVFLLTNKDDITFQTNKNEAYLIVGQNAMFSYYTKKIYNVPLNSKVASELDWNEFKVLEDYKEKGNYLIHYDTKWYLFDNDKNAISYEDNNIIAYKSNYDIDYQYVEATDILDDKYIKKVANENNVIAANLTISQELSMDIDNDDKNETFYVFSTALPIIPTENKEYSIVFMEKDNKTYTIFNTLDDSYRQKICQPKIEGFVNLNSNSNYEIIVSCSNISAQEQLVRIYEMTSDKGKIQFELKASNS